MVAKERKPAFRIGCITALMIAMIGIFILYSYTLKGELGKEVLSTLKEVSNQNVLIVQKEIESDKSALIEIAERISALELSEEWEIVDTLKSIGYRYSFSRMGFFQPNGLAYTTDGVVMNISDRDYYKETMTGNVSISDPLEDMVSEEEVIVFSVPIRNDDEIIGGVFATYSVESLKEILTVSSFDGAGYTYIVQQNGAKVVESINENSFKNMINIFESMEQADTRNAEPAKQLKDSLEQNESGYVIFYNGVSKYMHFTPLEINDWYLLDVVPVDVVETSTNYIMNRTYAICLALIVVYTFVVVMIFMGENKKKQQMKELLYVDSLTGGNTYARFKEDVEKLMKTSGMSRAYIMMDISDYKLVNELFGQEEGNKVLCYIWETIKNNCRAGEVAGRRIADRFTLFLSYEKKEEIEERIRKITEEIQSYSVQKAAEYILQPIFGVYYVEKNDEDAEDMLNCATLAHNLAKKERTNLYVIYSNDIKDNMLHKKQLSDQMDHAYRHHRFEVFYQPKYNAETKELAGAEALVRWRKSDGTMVPPGMFIPLAEETNFVCKLDKYVFKEVCVAQKRWIEKGLKVVPVSVNLSRRHLNNPEFVDEYKEILDEVGVPIECVQLEITESAMFEKQEEFIKLMERLHEIGFAILMDDFGTGYSSLTMLKQIPVNVMKLDKSFVDDYDDTKGEQIIRCVTKMAQNLDISITAEGVETEAQYIFLREIGCDVIQGYYFAKPMPEADYEKCMENCQAV